DSRAADLDVARRRVILAGDRAVPFSRLLVATGADPIVPPILRGYTNVHTLRDFDDAASLRPTLRPGRRLAVVGAGFLGLEVAATARSLGAEVAVIDIVPVPLARVLPAGVGGWFASLHRAEGGEMHLGDG